MLKVRLRPKCPNATWALEWMRFRQMAWWKLILAVAYEFDRLHVPGGDKRTATRLWKYDPCLGASYEFELWLRRHRYTLSLLFPVATSAVALMAHTKRERVKEAGP